jgi:hypothetical protein
MITDRLESSGRQIYDCGMAITSEDVTANLAAIAKRSNVSEFPDGNDTTEHPKKE